MVQLRKGFVLVLTLALGWLGVAGCANPALPPSAGTDDPVTLPPVPPPDPPADPAPDPPPDPPVDPPVVVSSSIRIDFQTVVPGVSAEGFSAAGFSPKPDRGQLNSLAWSVTGFSDGDLPFGGEAISGDLARGTSPGGVATGGLYAFAVEPENLALGIQPTASDFAPGTIALRVPVPPGTLTGCAISYRMWTRNDEDRETLWNIDYSLDGTLWTPLEDLATATPNAADGAPEWVPSDFAAEITLAEADLSEGDVVAFRWSAADGSGAGGRDESAIDDIEVRFTGLE